MKIDFKYRKRFDSFELDSAFSIADKGVTVLFGPSGCGKSTLLNCIAGLEKSDSAYGVIDNNLIDDDKNNICLATHERNIGYVFQDSRLFPHLNVLDNIAYGFKRTNGNKLNIEDVIEIFSINKLLKSFPHQLSGGQKQRVALARAIITDPQLLILDEPLSALDYNSKKELLPYIQRLNKEFSIPIIYVSHDLKEVLHIGDNIVLMDKGKVIDQGNLVDLCVTQPLLTQEEGRSFVLNGEVTKVNFEEKISTVNCQNHELLLSGNMLEIYQQVRILIHAKDVSLSLNRTVNTSILNIIPVKVSHVHEEDNGKHLVECSLGEVKILSVISIRSLHKLKIKPGIELFAQFKATAVVK